jgi:hypothetical protein
MKDEYDFSKSQRDRFYRRDAKLLRRKLTAFWAKIDEHGAEFLPEGRPEQPPMPIDNRKYFDDE